MKILAGITIVAIVAWALENALNTEENASAVKSSKADSETVNAEIATLGGGCFWCTEALLETLEGVFSVVSGYSGGHIKNPKYKEVCAETTGHAEVVQVKFDPNILSYSELLSYFWQCHDPTTLNRQGNDVGTQYRSIILYHSELQKVEAEKSKAEAAASFDAPIVTEIVPFEEFYPAEDEHQDFFRKNPTQRYCYFVIRPKLRKFKKLK